MNLQQQKSAAKEFIKRWQALPCIEEEHSRSFWIELIGEVLDVSGPTHILEFERKVKGRKIDVFCEDRGILIEQKSRGVSLDTVTIRSKKAGPETPFLQAKWYADNLANSMRPRWIITCNFDEFRIYDLEHPEEDYTGFGLEELADNLNLLSFFTDDSDSRLVKEEELSVEAGKVVGRLYDALSRQYHNLDTDEREQRSLNIIIVRIVFLLYAEDAGLLQSAQAFGNYLKNFDAEHTRRAIIELFEVLDTPEDERDPYLRGELLAFPYVNGGLFRDEDIVVPQFTEEMRQELILNASISFDWSNISPTIFGAVFESTLNPETRRSGGMHFTSVENIHRVIDPLFLDDLTDELVQIEGMKVEKTRIQRLRAFQKKLSELRFLDPAAGSHNFLTETYLSLRKLELRVIEDMQSAVTEGAIQTGFSENPDPIMVSINQFYAIEINYFAISVGMTALWIAEKQMMERTQELLPFQEFEFLPLKSAAHSHCGNALRMDWNDVLPAKDCSYIIGNPPFIGYSNHSDEQKEDRALIFGKVKTVDYVACWYKKAAEYMQANRGITAAFVSTNSICQGQQVEPIWKPLFDDGIHIDFAWPSFVWNSEATDQAHVHVVIVGFSRCAGKKPTIMSVEGAREVGNINGYLAPAESVFVSKRSKPLCNVAEMAQGFKPADGGNLLMWEDERDALLAADPGAQEYIRPFSMGAEFISGKKRYCVWIPKYASRVIKEHPALGERVKACRAWRNKQTQTGDAYKLRNTPHKLRPCGKFKDGTYIGVPTVSSERRKYIPMGFVADGMIPGNQLYFVPTDSLYVFGVLMSTAYNAWMRVTSGRLKSDYRISNTITHSNFPWPGVTPDTLEVPVAEAVPTDVRERVESCTQAVVDARAMYPDATLADLYDPDNELLYPELTAAHKELDAAVQAAYGVDFNGDESKIVAYLFERYSDVNTAVDTGKSRKEN